MTHSYVRHACFKCDVTYLWCCMNPSYVQNESQYVPWLILMCDVTHLYARHGSFLMLHDFFMCDMIHFCLYCDSFIYVLWFILMCDMTHAHVCHDSVICALLTHWNTLQHTATRCNTLQQTATHCYTLQYTATHCNTLHQHTATLQQIATHSYAHYSQFLVW